MDDTANLFAQSNPDWNLSFAQMFCIHLISIRQHTEIIVFYINFIGIQSEFQFRIWWRTKPNTELAIPSKCSVEIGIEMLQRK